MAAKEWHGVDRSTLRWHPIIDEEKCTNCGLCLLTCGAGVFGYEKPINRFFVLNPGNCTLGCTTCGKVCPEAAISFPESSKVFIRNIIKQGKIFPKVKEELKARLEKFPEHELHQVNN